MGQKGAFCALWRGVYKIGGLWYNSRMKKCISLLLVLLSTFGALAQADSDYWLPDWADGALKLPYGVELVEQSAFEDTAVKGVVLPSTVRSVQANAFAGIDGLERICVLSANASFGKNALGAKGETKEIWGYLNSTAEAYAEEYGYTFVRIYSNEDQLMQYAASKLGTKYVRGSWDCVLYVRNCYLTVFGVTLPDTCRAMEKLSESSLVSKQKLHVTRITDIRQLKTGDIICWCNDEVSYCTHVGMYVGEGTVSGKKYSSGVFIENSNGAGRVRYNYISPTGTGYYTRNFICAWRILP